jgi:hypothetical protein
MPNRPAVSKYDDLNRECRNIVDGRENFDGFHLDFARSIGQNFELSHVISFGSQTESASYSLAPRYYSKNFVLDGKLSPGPLFFNGDVQGRLHFPFYRRGTTKATLRLTGVVPKPSPKPTQAQMSVEADVRGPDYTAQVKWHSQGIWEAAYTQSVTRGCALGLMGYFDERSGVSMLTGSLRYKWNEPGGERVVVASAGPGQLTASYTQTSKDLRKAWTAEVQMVKPEGHPSWEAVYTAGYSYRLFQGSVKGRVDSNLCVSAILEERVLEPVSLLICGDMNYKKDIYKVGFGFSFHF